MKSYIHTEDCASTPKAVLFTIVKKQKKIPPTDQQNEIKHYNHIAKYSQIKRNKIQIHPTT